MKTVRVPLEVRRGEFVDAMRRGKSSPAVSLRPCSRCRGAVAVTPSGLCVRCWVS